MNPPQISVYQPGAIAIAAFALLVSFICYFDGPLYVLYAITGTVPPNLLVFSTLMLVLGFWYVMGGHIRPEGFSRALLVATLFLIWWLVQTLFGISVYVLGYLQKDEAKIKKLATKEQLTEKTKDPHKLLLGILLE